MESRHSQDMPGTHLRLGSHRAWDVLCVFSYMSPRGSFGHQPKKAESHHLQLASLTDTRLFGNPKSSRRPGALLTSNRQIAKKEPATDEGLTRVPGQLLHDVQVRGVEAQGRGREAICHQVHPEQLHRDQGFGQAQNCREEDAGTRVTGSSPQQAQPLPGRGPSSRPHPRLGSSLTLPAAALPFSAGDVCAGGRGACAWLCLAPG